jgi:hypothetical protein
MVSPEASVMVGNFEANTMVARSPRENRIASRLVALPALQPSTAELVLAALMASLTEQSPWEFDPSSLVFTVTVVPGTAALAGSALTTMSTKMVAARAAANRQSATDRLLVRYSDAVFISLLLFPGLATTATLADERDPNVTKIVTKEAVENFS